MATAVLGPAIGFVVLKLDDVSIELQNPFGFDKSDLDICALTDLYQETLHAQLLAYAREGEREKVPQKEIDDVVDKQGLTHSF